MIQCGYYIYEFFKNSKTSDPYRLNLSHKIN